MRQCGELFRYFFSAYPGRSAAMVAGLTVAAATEAVGIAALLPMIGIVISGEGNAGASSEPLSLVKAELSLATLSVVIVAALATKAAVMMAVMREVAYCAAQAAMHLRSEAVESLVQARWSYYADQHAGKLASALGTEPERAAESYIATCHVLTCAIQLIVYISICITISWETTATALVVGVMCIAPMKRLMTKSHEAGIRKTQVQRRLMTRLLQGVEGMKTLKAMGRESDLKALMRADIETLKQVRKIIARNREALKEANDLIRGCAVVCGLYLFVSVWSFPAEGLLVLALLFIRILQKVNQGQAAYQSALTTQPAFASLRATIEEAKARSETRTGRTIARLSNEISLRNVRFAHGRNQVLDGVDMSVRCATFTAIVGPSGSGKTTIADLVIGLRRPDTGEVWIDDVAMSDADLERWRNSIGYVPQETFIFHDTIRANVTLGDDGIDTAQVEMALRRAGAWRFVDTRSEGIDEVIGERGGKLSGGERQRLAIARALVRKPRLLILDEATSALDRGSEAEIIDTLRQLAGEITVLAISHQAAMSEKAEVVYRITDGRALVEADRRKEKGAAS